jgi:hypothetical protein
MSQTGLEYGYFLSVDKIKIILDPDKTLADAWKSYMKSMGLNYTAGIMDDLSSLTVKFDHPPSEDEFVAASKELPGVCRKQIKVDSQKL